jgi:hypothetical protein
MRRKRDVLKIICDFVSSSNGGICLAAEGWGACARLQSSHCCRLDDVLDPGGKISRAAVFVLDRDGIVRWSYIADDYKIRPLDEQLLTELAKIK